MQVYYLTLDEALLAHSALIQEYGGLHGVRDTGLFIAAMERPKQTFGGQELYPSLWLKAAAMFHSIVHSHPFLDGNKRTALTVAVLLLRLNGWKLVVAQDALFDFILRAVRQKYDVPKIAAWLQKRCKRTR